jgi:hypothetical protein
METIYKEVDFFKYCEQCKYHDLDDSEDPCNECLTHPCMEHSRKPFNFKPEQE